MKRKGYFFMLDAMLGLGILVIAVGLLMQAYVHTPSRYQSVNFAEDVLDFFSNVRIENYNNQYFGINGNLTKEGIIKDTKKSLLQQLGEFHYYNNTNMTQYLITNITEGKIPFQFKYEFSIDDVRVYPGTIDDDFIKSKNTSNLLFPAKRISFGNINQSFEHFGPYEVEVLIWQ